MSEEEIRKIEAQIEEKVKVKCPKCGYEWFTRSKRIYIQCPSCRKVFQKEKAIVK
jgi:lipopolysaccharide biosynthesis regulator YciM